MKKGMMREKTERGSNAWIPYQAELQQAATSCARWGGVIKAGGCQQQQWAKFFGLTGFID
jgi:hypothetical protein